MRHVSWWSRLLVLTFTLAGCKDDPKSPAHWEKRLSDAKRVREKTHILSELRDSGYLDAAMVPMLNASLGKEKAPEVKAEIVHMLTLFKNPSSVQPLLDAIDFGDTDRSGHAMNKDIAVALGQIGDPKATSALLRLLRSRDAYTRVEAVNSLGALHAREATDPLLQTVGDETADPFLVKKAIQALGDIGDPKAVPALIKMLFKEKRGITFYPESSFALFQIGRPASDALLAVIRDEDRGLTVWAKENNVLKPALYAKSAQILGDLQETRALKPLLGHLGFQSEYLDLKLFVRMRAADALGRLRAPEAIKPLVAALGETDEPAALREYVTALARIGGKESIPALEKLAGSADWDIRQSAILCLAMLGDDQEVPRFEKFVGSENSLTLTQCKEDPNAGGCREPTQTAKNRMAIIEKYQKVSTLAGHCKGNPTCWAGKLDDPEPLVRERAALELGRTHQAGLVDELAKRVGDRNLEARAAMILAINWLIGDSKDALLKARSSLSSVEKQLATDKGRLEFVAVNQDLQRLVVRLRQ